MTRVLQPTRDQLAIPWIFACLLLPAAANGDGGAVLLKETAAPFVITVFIAPQPLRAGTADLSILVQDQERGEPILDADVSVQLSRPAAFDGAGWLITAAATHAQATNKLLYAANLDLPVPGAWTLRVDVHQGTATAQVRAQLSLAPALPAPHTIWPYLLVPPVTIPLVALHQWLARQRVRPR